VPNRPNGLQELHRARCQVLIAIAVTITRARNITLSPITLSANSLVDTFAVPFAVLIFAVVDVTIVKLSMSLSVTLHLLVVLAFVFIILERHEFIVQRNSFTELQKGNKYRDIVVERVIKTPLIITAYSMGYKDSNKDRTKPPAS